MNKEMNYEKFTTELMEKLKGMTGEECTLSMIDIPVINGNVKHSLAISRKNRNAAPCICMDGFYHDYVKGYLKMEDIAEMTSGLYRQEMEHDDLETEFMKEWKSAERKIRFRLVSTERNAGMLKEMPHREFLDLSLVYYVQVPMPDDMNGIVHIYSGLLKCWDVDEEDLYRAAMENMPETKHRSMGEIIGAAEGRKAENTGGPLCSMYVVTNKNGLYGAACMLDMEMMQKTADGLGSDLLILPSSVHELILILQQDPYDVQELSGIVKEINDTELRPDEVLSGHVYQYNRETGKISIAA